MTDRTTVAWTGEWRPSEASYTYAEKIANGVTLIEGSLVGLEGGYLNHWADGANDVFVGIVSGPGIGITGTTAAGAPAAITGNTSGSPIPEAKVITGVILMGLTVLDTPTQAKVGDLVYLTDSDYVNLTLEGSTPINAVGWMCRYTSATDQEVRLFTPTEFIAHRGSANYGTG
jgi:hypothetical protein